MDDITKGSLGRRGSSASRAIGPRTDDARVSSVGKETDGDVIEMGVVLLVIQDFLSGHNQDETKTSPSERIPLRDL